MTRVLPSICDATTARSGAPENASTGCRLSPHPIEPAIMTAIALRRVTTASFYLVMAAVFHRIADAELGIADVTDCAGTEAFRPRVVLALLDVLRGLVEQALRLLEAIAVAPLRIDRRVIVERLAVIDRCSLDLVDRGVELADRVVLVPLHLGASRALEQRARDAHVRQRVQVRGVRAHRGRRR